MTDSDQQSLVAILRHCAGQAPAPWYPSAHARAQGIDRNSLDPYLERLRLAGLIQLTPWTADAGQGYRLTDEGTQVLARPRDLKQLQQGRLPQRLHPSEEFDLGGLTPDERGRFIRAALGEHTTATVVPLLLLVNLFVFGCGMVLAQRDLLLGPYVYPGTGQPGLWEIQHRLGALSGADMLRGEWWRLLTCSFVHLGIFHLFVNLVTLHLTGPYIEQLWGRWRFLAIYLLSALGGSCAMVLTNPRSGGAGASGAIWGMVASSVTFILINRQHLPGAVNPRWLRNLVTVVVLNVGISMLPGIGAAAHFGGGFTGVVAALLMNSQRFGHGWRKALATLALLALPGLCLGALAWNVRHDPRWLGLAWLAQAREILHFQQHLPAWLREDPDEVVAAFKKDLQPEVLNVHPSRRDPAQVEKARGIVVRERQRLAELTVELKRAGPYDLPALERARLAATELVASAEELYRLAAVALTPDDNWRQTDQALGEQLADLEERVRTWQAAWTQLHAVRDVR